MTLIYALFFSYFCISKPKGTVPHSFVKIMMFDLSDYANYFADVTLNFFSYTLVNLRMVNKEKNILGMMPHPERMIDKYLSGDDGIIFFETLLNNSK